MNKHLAESNMPNAKVTSNKIGAFCCICSLVTLLQKKFLCKFFFGTNLHNEASSISQIQRGLSLS